MRIALVHDYLNQMGGAERVVQSLHRLYPEAPLYTSIYAPDRVDGFFRQMDVRASFMQRLPFAARAHQAYLLFYPLAFEAFSFKGFDVIISSSSAWAKAIIPPAEALHICYCHNPMRFAWNYQEYVQGERVGRLARFALPAIMALLRQWDTSNSNRVDHFIANSHVVAKRIARCYRRQATVIHPPVSIRHMHLSPTHADYYLVVSRLIPYKRIDLVIRAFNELKLPLKVVGDGRQRAALERLAAGNHRIEFVGRATPAELADYLARCRALIFPGEEDFGIVPIEAMASGRPVLAFKGGGALETVVEGLTGSFFAEQTVESLCDAVVSFRADEYDPVRIREHATRFDEAHFHARVADFVASKYAEATG